MHFPFLTLEEYGFWSYVGLAILVASLTAPMQLALGMLL